MRIGVREQLGIVVAFVALLPLAVLAIAVWITSYNFITAVTKDSLSLTASLKASQIASDINLIHTTCGTIVTRILLQNALKDFYRGNRSATNWTDATTDVAGALASGGSSALLQVTVFSRNSTGNSFGLFNVTSASLGIQLPGTAPNGSVVMLGDEDLGYPSALYPNITYTRTSTPDPADPSTNGTIAMAYNDYPLTASSHLFLGPLQINQSFAMVSITLPMNDNSAPGVILGYMTIVAAATSLIEVTQSQEGLGDTGSVLLVGPNRKENIFKEGTKASNATYSPEPDSLKNTTVKFVFPPYNTSDGDRHSTYNANLSTFGSSNFTEGAYPAVLAAFERQNPAINNASSTLSTHNENNASVAVGWARPQTTLVDWLLILEQSHDEAWRPINKLKTIVLSCVFGTVGLILLVVVPIAHYSVRPIRRLRDASKKAIAPPGYTPNGSIRSERLDSGDELGDEENAVSTRSKKGIMVRLKRLRQTGRRKSKLEQSEEDRRRVFKIPAEVPDRKHLITDEISELTTTFNAMSKELLLQYTSLEAKVAERTEQLEMSKKAAEAANESKTLFIANISHELKTPLNGILGMTAVCLGEEDLPRIKRSLQVIYKSGDLLLHLLNDLLTFSKNQIGQQLSLEEKEFRLVDVRSQIITIFDQQVREGHINFGVKFIGTATDDAEMSEESALPALGPNGLGRLKDMCLWGDQHRILQVIINLVSNSLKFTPEGGKVEVRIKCLGEVESISDGSRNSMGSKQSKQSSQRNSRTRHRNGSASNNSQTSSKKVGPKHGTALMINPLDPKAAQLVQMRDRSPGDHPPSNARNLLFQFEVEDTGPGIPDHLQERVFEPFVQGDLGLSKKYGGTGLGLSICSQLAGLMGGEIGLVSKENVGTTFTMQIPLKHTRDRPPSTSSSDAYGSRPPSEYNHTLLDEPVTSKSPGKLLGDGNLSGSITPGSSSIGYQKDTQPRLVGLSQPFFATAPSSAKASNPSDQLAAIENVAARESGTKLRILVAEDNLVNQEVVLRMLKLESVYDVVVAKDGQEAYDMVKENMENGRFFDLIFMDIQMPNLDGLQSTRLIRQMGYSAPIVALTAFAEESNVKECYDSGMNHFLSKPIRRPALKQVLKKFATIPEEDAETSSLTRKSSPEIASSATTSSPEVATTPPLVNGTSSST